ncbi:HTH CENPB-type domain-containing protein [Mycena indigotica]|uniref:HTH CENPB-type domain-containing protein n=1 Tax=Mycena indigotica TaxID=2126181 RepID=A0A8H6W948_9AGAR|nr:HTH CENPB-type domain-containing protein [Mycena indigotica]KAF7310319.1 HTH CENPB-type domain-containing protein [Mycena indigotica]
MWLDLLEATLAGEMDFEFGLPVLGEARDTGDVEEDAFSDFGDDKDQIAVGNLNGASDDLDMVQPQPVESIPIPATASTDVDGDVNMFGLADAADKLPNSDDDDNEELAQRQEPVAILPENLYGADKSGFMAASNTRTWVIGVAGAKMQH